MRSNGAREQHRGQCDARDEEPIDSLNALIYGADLLMLDAHGARMIAVRYLDLKPVIGTANSEFCN
jgi:hypothetical protein